METDLMKGYCSVCGYNVGVNAIGDNCPNDAGHGATT